MMVRLALVTVLGLFVASCEGGGARPPSSDDFVTRSQALDAARGLTQARAHHTATLLTNGSVLVAGGQGGAGALRSAELRDPVTGRFSPVDSLSQARAHHTATLLSDGRVLVVGGTDALPPAPPAGLTSAELFDPVSRTFSPAPAPTQARAGHTAVWLHDGRVLVAGGVDALGERTFSAQIFDPSTNIWSDAAAMLYARAWHTATLLPNGRVLVTGGDEEGTTAEIYDPAARSWIAIGGRFSTPRAHHTATLLPDGGVLVAGGGTAERFDPQTATITPAGSMRASRSSHGATLLPSGHVLVTGTAASFEVFDAGSWRAGLEAIAARTGATDTLLPNGRVLVVGGLDALGAPLASVELLSSPAFAWEETQGWLRYGRHHHSAIPLPDGKVLVAGGYGPFGNGVSFENAETELFDPATGLWTVKDAIPARADHTETRLSDGRWLLIGGVHPTRFDALDTTSVFDPATGLWSNGPKLAQMRSEHTATLLANGDVLVVGGIGVPGSRLASVERYDRQTGMFVGAAPLPEGRSGHRAVRLRDGRVLVAGGRGPSGTLASAVVYDPARNQWTAVGSMLQGRRDFTLTLLPSGELLAAGGSSGGDLTSCELFDPASGAWAPAAALSQARSVHRAVVLARGEVLATGGYSSNSKGYAELVEMYDPATDSWLDAGSLPTWVSHIAHTATVLPGGGVLLVGDWLFGADVSTAGGPLRDQERDGPSLGNPGELVPGSPFTVPGARLAGHGGGSAGATNDSPAYVPILSLQTLDGAERWTLRIHRFAPGSITAQLPDVPRGEYLLTVTVAALSDSRVVRVMSNTPPEARDSAAETDEDMPVTIAVDASDADGDALTFVVISGPSHGRLVPAPGGFTYTPDADFHGTDSFAFQADDGAARSSTATVTITVHPVNDPPVAHGASVTTDEDVAVAITLTGSDPDGDALTFHIVDAPSRGTLSGEAPALTYTPERDGFGDPFDSFTFVVRDGQAESAKARVTIAVRPVNDPPTALSQALETFEETPLPITLAGTDPDGDTLTFIVISGPSHGRLEPADGGYLYTPDADFHGTDSFEFQADDGAARSPSATVTITVHPVNDPPVAHGASVTTDEDVPVAITLTGSDPDGDALTFHIVDAPSRGTLSGEAPALTYTPERDGFGDPFDSFTFVVRDGQAESAKATVTIAVRPVNDPPTALSQELDAFAGIPLSITLTGTDPDGDTLDYRLVTLPAHGTLEGTAPALTYLAPEPFEGKDSFTFVVNDLAADSLQAVVTIHVHPRPNTPPTRPVPVRPAPGAREASGELSFEWEPSLDIDGDALTYAFELYEGDERIAAATTDGTTWALPSGKALEPGDYRWRVRATDSRGLDSDWSEEASFSVVRFTASDDGCGCAGTSGSGWTAFAALAGLLLRRRRR